MQQKGGEIVVINLAESDNDDLLQDLSSIIYSFCARLYGKRRARNKADMVAKVLEEK